MASPEVSVTPAKNSDPVISDAADKALRPWVMIGMPLSMLFVILSPLAYSVLYAKYPKNPLLAGHFSPIALLSGILWMVPAYYTFTNVYAIRLKFGRKYVAEKRWKEAEASLGSHDSLILTFFDNTGEAHYLWAQALDGLGRKNAAEKARDFIRKRRSKSPYAAMLAGAPTPQIVSASELRKREADMPSDQNSTGTTSNLKKIKRRRF